MLFRSGYFGEFTHLNICLTLHGIFSMQVNAPTSDGIIPVVDNAYQYKQFIVLIVTIELLRIYKGLTRNF